MVFACQTANTICFIEGGFEIRGFGGCIFALTVICKSYCMFIVSLLYRCPSYYFLLVWVLILHICKQLCSSAAVVPQSPYAFPC